MTPTRSPLTAILSHGIPIFTRPKISDTRANRLGMIARSRIYNLTPNDHSLIGALVEVRGDPSDLHPHTTLYVEGFAEHDRTKVFRLNPVIGTQPLHLPVHPHVKKMRTDAGVVGARLTPNRLDPGHRYAMAVLGSDDVARNLYFDVSRKVITDHTLATGIPTDRYPVSVMHALEVFAAEPGPLGTAGAAKQTEGVHQIINEPTKPDQNPGRDVIWSGHSSFNQIIQALLDNPIYETPLLQGPRVMLFTTSSKKTLAVFSGGNGSFDFDRVKVSQLASTNPRQWEVIPFTRQGSWNDFNGTRGRTVTTEQGKFFFDEYGQLVRTELEEEEKQVETQPEDVIYDQPSWEALGIPFVR